MADAFWPRGLNPTQYSQACTPHFCSSCKLRAFNEFKRFQLVPFTLHSHTVQMTVTSRGEHGGGPPAWQSRGLNVSN